MFSDKPALDCRLLFHSLSVCFLFQLQHIYSERRPLIPPSKLTTRFWQDCVCETKPWSIKGCRPLRTAQKNGLHLFDEPVAVEGVRQDGKWSPIIFLKFKVVRLNTNVTLSEGCTKKRDELKWYRGLSLPKNNCNQFAISRLNVRLYNPVTKSLFLARSVFYNKEGLALDSLLLIRSESKGWFWRSARRFSDCFIHSKSNSNACSARLKTSWISSRRNRNLTEIITNLPRLAYVHFQEHPQLWLIIELVVVLWWR